MRLLGLLEVVLTLRERAMLRYTYSYRLAT